MVGFRIRNKNAIGESFRCPVCTLLLRKPVQLSCGHRQCESCTDDQDKTMIECMQCHEETLRYNMFPDRGVENDMRMLNICCSYCSWTGVFSNYQSHLILCRTKNALLQFRRLQKTFDEHSKNVQLLKRTLSQVSNDASAYSMSIEEQSPPGEVYHQNQDTFVSRNGTLSLKINGIHNRLNDHQSVITSAPFYTAANGYKVSFRLHLGGNGDGKSTHVSIFLILMRGDHDALLQWPFNHQVIFALHDLSGQKEHLIHSFQSNEKSRCFQRPQSNVNIATGLSKFIPRSIIQENNSPYVCEDSIYVTVMIRKDPLPISILPNVMSIDPAWPVYKQEEQIQQEVTKSKMPLLKLSLTLKPQQLK